MEREYEYRPKWTFIALCAGFFGLGVLILGSKAATNNRGLVINHVIELGPGGATAFFWIFTACNAGFVGVAALLACHRLTFRQRLAFSPAGLTVPASRWSRGEKEIAYRDIQGLSETTVNGQRFLYITHPGGTFIVIASMLSSRAAFAEAAELLAARVREAHAAGQRDAQPHAAPNHQS